MINPVGRKVVFTGYPSYLQGKKGVVTTKSSMWQDTYFIEFFDGTYIWIHKRHFEVIDDEQSSN